jgi:tetratricopeptide (TPR) repeat protein
MKYLLSLAIIFSLLSTYGQQENQTKSEFLYLHEQKINDGDFLDVHSFKDLVVKGNSLISEEENLKLKFVIVPIGINLLSFEYNLTELKNLNMDEMLEVGGIPKEKITHSIIYIMENEVQLNSVKVSAKKYEVGDEYFFDFESYAAIGDAEMAIWSIEQAIKLEPTNLEYLNSQGKLFFDLKDYNQSKSQFESILETEPNYLSYEYLGYNLFQLGEYEKAIEANQNAIKLTKSKTELSNRHCSIAESHAKNSDFKNAYKSYKKSLKYNPNNITSLNNISTVCDKVGKRKKKISYLNRVIEADPSFYLVHINIGFHYLKQEKYKEAISEFDEVLKIDSLQPNALSNKAFCLYKLDQLNEAQIWIDKAIVQSPSNSYAYKNRALIEIALKDIESACNDLDIANQLNYTQQYGDEVNELKSKYCK